MWLKLAKMTKNWIFRFFWKSLILYCIRSKNVSNVFHGLKNVKKAEKSLKICQFLPILNNFSYILWIKITFWKKLVDRALTTYLKFHISWIYMLWGIQNQLRFFFTGFGLNCPSAWCECPRGKSLRPYFSTPTVITFGVSFELLLFWHLMSYFLNVNCRYLVIMFNEIKVWAGIEACFATVKYSIYCLKTPQKATNDI
jgi:hypothetical protein